MLKRIEVIAILISIFIAGNLLAGDEENYFYDLKIELHGFCTELIVGYEAQDGWHTVYDDCSGLPTGTYEGYDFTIPWNMYPANDIVVKGWGDYAAYDEDECPASIQYKNELELWIGCTPPGEEDPPE